MGASMTAERGASFLDEQRKRREELAIKAEQAVLGARLIDEPGLDEFLRRAEPFL